MTERAIRIGVSVKPQHTSYDAMKATWLAVEAAGLDDLYIWDHFYPLSGDEWGNHFECFTLLASVATLTEKVRFGPLVSCNSYRNPNLLADMARTIDHISNGRFILGVGSGWKEQDYDEYGFPFKTAPDRLRDLKANLPIIKERLEKLNPKSVQDPMPILIGGGGEKVTLKLVAQYADMWNGFGTPNDAAHKLAILDEHCAAVGRDPKAIERSIMVPITTTAETADQYLALGVTTLIVGIDADPSEVEKMSALLQWRDNKR